MLKIYHFKKKVKFLTFFSIFVTKNWSSNVENRFYSYSNMLFACFTILKLEIIVLNVPIIQNYKSSASKFVGVDPPSLPMVWTTIENVFSKISAILQIFSFQLFFSFQASIVVHSSRPNCSFYQQDPINAKVPLFAQQSKVFGSNTFSAVSQHSRLPSVYLNGFLKG